MRHASPFPPWLAGRLFTLRQARAAGLPEKRLRAQDVDRIARGLYAQGLDGPPSEAAVVSGLNLLYSSTWASHVTAARLLRLHLPRGVGAAPEIHLSRPSLLPPLDVQGIVSHRLTSTAGEVARLRTPVEAPPESRLQVTTYDRTWLDLATYLPEPDLIVIGDQLLRLPRPGFEGRTEPLSTRESLHATILRHPRARGIGHARAALQRLRVGSDSPAETRLRLALVAAGLPEPELQLRLDPANRFSPVSDLGYREAKIAVQYDGYHHRSAEQLATDNRRDLAFALAGWTYLKFDWKDARDGFARAVFLLRRALAETMQ